MNKYDIVPWNAWNNVCKVQLGGYLLECLQKSSGWFESVEKKINNKSDAFVITTDEFNKNKEQIVKITELFSPLTKPMLIEPRDWTNLHDGGYYLNQLTNCHEMVRRGEPLRIQGKTTYQVFKPNTKG